MDWMLFWTALVAVIAIVGMIAGWIQWLRSGDAKDRAEFRSSVTDRFNAQDREIASVANDTKQRLEKADFERYQDKQEILYSEFRKELRDGQNDLGKKIDENQKETNAKLDNMFNKLFDLIKKG